MLWSHGEQWFWSEVVLSRIKKCIRAYENKVLHFDQQYIYSLYVCIQFITIIILVTFFIILVIAGRPILIPLRNLELVWVLNGRAFWNQWR